MKNNPVDCDNCGKTFIVKPKVKNHPKGIKETYFVCTHCKEKYVAYVMDDECMQLQREIRSLQASKQNKARLFTTRSINGNEYMAGIDEIDQEIKNKQKTLKNHMNNLKMALT